VSFLDLYPGEQAAGGEGAVALVMSVMLRGWHVAQIASKA
jgi:hypothetical protein